MFLILATFFLFACENKNQEAVEEESDLIEITNQQFLNDSMQLGKIERRVFENKVQCNGTIIPLPDGMAQVSTLFQGVVKNIYIQNGQYVNKNQPIMEIGGNEIIDIQNEYAEASANYKRLKSEYLRIKSLYEEKVTSEKDFISAEAEYKTAMARYNGLRLKMQAIGFSAASIENGEIYSFYSIKSPISGYVSNLNTNIGSYIDSQTDLLEIINPEMFQLKLSVFADDIGNLKKGQSVRFQYANQKTVHLATLRSIGVAIDKNTKSIECYADIRDKGQENPIAQRFLQAEIVTNTDTVTALPSSAIGKNESGYFIFILDSQKEDKYLFSKMEVKAGRQYEGYTEIANPSINGMILTNGIYNMSF